MKVGTNFAYPSNDNTLCGKVVTFAQPRCTPPTHLGTVYYNSVEELEQAFVALTNNFYHMTKACELLKESRDQLLQYVESLS